MIKRMILGVMLLGAFTLSAQNQEGKLDDVGRIALAAVVPTDIEGFSPSSQSFLESRLNQITSRHGMGGSVLNERFIIAANVQILSKDITGTAPAMHAYTLEVGFYIGDGLDGTLFATTTKTYKGVGNNETKAFRAALQNIKAGDPSFEAFLEEGKKKIIEYFNTRCDIIMKQAETLASAGEYEHALYTLMTIPEVSKDCYFKAMDAVGPMYQEYIDYRCQSLLSAARAAWSEGQDSQAAQNASVYLEQIDPNSKCFGDVEKLINEISKRIRDVDDREWDFIVDTTKQTIEAARQVGVAYGQNQPQNVTYNYRGWW